MDPLEQEANSCYLIWQDNGMKIFISSPQNVLWDRVGNSALRTLYLRLCWSWKLCTGVFSLVILMASSYITDVKNLSQVADSILCTWSSALGLSVWHRVVLIRSLPSDLGEVVCYREQVSDTGLSKSSMQNKWKTLLSKDHGYLILPRFNTH